MRGFTVTLILYAAANSAYGALITHDFEDLTSTIAVLGASAVIFVSAVALGFHSSRAGHPLLFTGVALRRSPRLSSPTPSRVTP